MSETTALLWMILIIALRFGLPLFMVLVVGNLLNTWIERHPDKAQIT